MIVIQDRVARYGWDGPPVDLMPELLADRARKLSEAIERTQRAPAPRWQVRRYRHCRRWHRRWLGPIDWDATQPRRACARCQVWWVW